MFTISKWHTFNLLDVTIEERVITTRTITIYSVKFYKSGLRRVAHTQPNPFLCKGKKTISDRFSAQKSIIPTIIKRTNKVVTTIRK